MTTSSQRPTSPNARLRQRVSARLRARTHTETGALSAEFAVLMCVGAGLAFALYTFAKSGGLVKTLVGVVATAVSGLIGGIG